MRIKAHVPDDIWTKSIIENHSLSLRKSKEKWVGQKSRSDRDWKERDPPNRGCRGGLGWGQSFEERRLRVTKRLLVTLIIILSVSGISRNKMSQRGWIRCFLF